MTDPGEPDLAVRQVREKRVEMRAEALGEERGDENLGQEIPLMPAFPQAHLDWGRGAFRLGGRDGRAGFFGNLFPFFHWGKNYNPDRAGRNE